MEGGKEVEEFKKRSVLAICSAGSDRSKYIAEELNNRGYSADYRGTLKNHNYVTKEDLNFIGTIVFSSIYDKKQFEEIPNLKDYVKRKGIKILIMNITESQKERAIQSQKFTEFKNDISVQLDAVGLKALNNKPV